MGSDARKRDERVDVTFNFAQSWKAEHLILRDRPSVMPKMVERIEREVKFAPASSAERALRSRNALWSLRQSFDLEISVELVA